MNIIRNLALGYYRTGYPGEYTNTVRSLHPVRLENNTSDTCVDLYLLGRRTTTSVRVHPGGGINMGGSIWRSPDRSHGGYWI